eukprot:6187903-Pleurochrysis_carterae.AAC.3
MACLIDVTRWHVLNNVLCPLTILPQCCSACQQGQYHGYQCAAGACDRDLCQEQIGTLVLNRMSPPALVLEYPLDRGRTCAHRHARVRAVCPPIERHQLLALTYPGGASELIIWQQFSVQFVRIPYAIRRSQACESDRGWIREGTAHEHRHAHRVAGMTPYVDQAAIVEECLRLGADVNARDEVRSRARECRMVASTEDAVHSRTRRLEGQLRKNLRPLEPVCTSKGFGAHEEWRACTGLAN